MAIRERHIVSAWEVKELITHYFEMYNPDAFSVFKMQEFVDRMLRRLLLKDVTRGGQVAFLLNVYLTHDQVDEVIERCHDLMLILFKPYLVYDHDVEVIEIVDFETRDNCDIVIDLKRKEPFEVGTLDQFASDDNGDYIPHRLR